MSEFRRLFDLVFKFVKHRKLRSILTTLGIAVGVALVFSLMSINGGLQKYISDSMEGMGTNLVTVMPKAMLNPMSGIIPPFDKDDIDALDNLYFVKNAYGLSVSMLPIEIKGEEFYQMVFGTKSGMTKLFSEMESFKIEKGRDFTLSDRGKVVMGYALAKTYNLAPGSQIKIDDLDFRVIGVIGEIGNSEDDNSILIHIEDLWEIIGVDEEYNMIYLDVLELKTEEIEKALEKSRDAEDFDVMTIEGMMEQVDQILLIVNAVFLALASISLIVGSFGVANTMYMAVLERHKDIGIMKAIGASSKVILLIFVIEAGFLSLLGGIMGIVLGMGLAKLFVLAAVLGAGLTTLEAVFSFEMFIITAVLSFIIGVVSGYLPAKNASRLEPVEAFRHS